MALNPDLQAALQQANALAGRGQFAEAEAAYRRARSIDPNDLYAAIGHGHVLRMLSRPAEARDVFTAAIALNSDVADSHHGLALAAQEMSDFSAAEAAWRTVLRLQPTSLAAAIGLAELFNLQQRPDEALALLAGFNSDASPARAGLEQARGTARLLKNENDAALTHFERVLAITPDHPKAAPSRAVALQHLGRMDEALDAFRKAVADNPANLAAHQSLNDLLHRLKRDSEFLRSYDEAASRMPGVPHFAIAKAQYLVRDGRSEDAVALYDRALEIAPGNPLAQQGKAEALLALGRAGAAIDFYRHVLQQAPDNAAVMTRLAGAYLVAREADKAEAVAAQALARDPADQVALATLGIAWRLQDSPREHDLNRYDDFIQVIDLEPPPGYADMTSFNQALNVWLDSQHSDSREPIDQSLRGGTQTLGNIFGSGHALIKALQTRIYEAVARFIASLPRDAQHPFLARRSQDFRFSGAWSSRLCDQGFHANHLHPGGWISSAYYVALPDSMADAQQTQGWIQFGQPSYEVGLTDPVRRAVQPKEGRLVLFPSYMWHGTVPFAGPQSRTTIAFDVVPQQKV